MTLVLANPGGGSTTLLKLLSARASPSKGAVKFNGTAVDELGAQGVDARRVAAYIDQSDVHEPLFTVRETFEFAANSSFGGSVTAKGAPSQDFTSAPNRAEAMARLLDLETCADTVVGDQNVRGISGGQKRRTSIGEILLTEPRVLCGDEITAGLDAAVAEEITRRMQQYARRTDATVVLSLKQATPETYNLFDDVVLLSDGHVIYHGPREELEDNLARRGFPAPEEGDFADWLAALVTDPTLALPPNYTGQVPTGEAMSTGPNGWYSSEAFTTAMGRKPPARSSVNQGLNRPGEQREEYDDLPAFLDSSEYLKVRFGSGSDYGGLSRFGSMLNRQFNLTIRNPVLTFVRFQQAIFLGLLFGGTFFQPDVDEFAPRLGVAIFVSINVSFGNFPELQSTMAGRATAYKLSRAGLFDEFSYVASVWLVHAPFAILNSLVLSLSIYFMVDFTNEASRFFFFWLIVAGVELAMSGWFRFVTYASPRQELAQTLAGASTGVFLLMAGFLVTRTNIPEFMRWLYYISPFSWAVRSLALNEFFADRYDEPLEVAGGGPPMGNNMTGGMTAPADPPLKRNAFLDVFEIQRDPKDAWQWGTVGVLYGYWILFAVVLSGLAVTYCKYDSRPGTQRIHDEEARKEMSKQRTLSRRSPSPGPGKMAARAQDEEGGPAASPSGVSPAQDAPEDPPKRTSSLAAAASRFEAATLSFQNIRYSVTVPSEGAFMDKAKREVQQFEAFNKKRTEAGFKVPDTEDSVPKEPEVNNGTIELKLLRGISGVAQPRRMICLMGASGAGKTTLMDVLAGRKTQGKESGEVLVNGKVMSKDERSSLIAYCEQTDEHLPTNTVEESLEFSAQLRLDADMANDSELRAAFVQEIMRLLELDSIRGRPAGSLAMGEAKRLTIGCELAANPSLLFLDEPTTGLDARSAAQVMRVLRNVSDTGRTVVCTIHQPSYDVFAAFDDLLLLAQGGRQVYFGPIGENCATFSQYLQGAPTVSKLPHRVNPATWMLTELDDELARMRRIAAGTSSPTSGSKPAEKASNGASGASAAAAAVSPGDSEEKTSGAAAAGGAEAADAEALQLRHPLLFERFSQSEAAEQAQQLVSREKARGEADGARKVQGREKVGGLVRFWAVLYRTFADNYRNTSFNGARFVTLAVLAAIFGLMFFDLDVNKDQGSVLSMLGVLQAAAGFGGIISFTTQVPLLFDMRPVFYRERSAGLYSASNYFVAMSIKEVLYLALLSLVFTPIVYSLVDLRWDETSVFWETVASVYVTAIWLSWLAQFFVTAFPSAQVAQILVGVLLNNVNLFNGIFVSGVKNYSDVFRWITYINPLFLVNVPLALTQAHCFEAGEGASEQERIAAGCPTIEVLRDGVARVETVEAYIEDFVDAKYEDRWIYYVAILAVAVFFQLVAQLLGTYVNYQKR